MNEARANRGGRKYIPLTGQKCPSPSAVRVGRRPEGGVISINFGVTNEGQVADLDHMGGTVAVMFVIAIQIVLELQPIEPPDSLVAVRVDKEMLFGLGDTVEKEPPATSVVESSIERDISPGLKIGGQDVAINAALNWKV